MGYIKVFAQQYSHLPSIIEPIVPIEDSVFALPLRLFSPVTKCQYSYGKIVPLLDSFSFLIILLKNL